MTDAPTKLITATIKEITQAQGGNKGTYHKLTTAPIGQQKYPSVYNVWDSELLEGVKTGDAVQLTLQRGRAKIADPQQDKDYYWDVTAVSKAVVQDGPWPGDDTVKAPQAPKQPVVPPQKSGPVVDTGNQPKPPFLTDTEQFLAKQRSIAWSVALEQAVIECPGEADNCDRILAVARKFFDYGQKVLNG